MTAWVRSGKAQIERMFFSLPPKGTSQACLDVSVRCRKSSARRTVFDRTSEIAQPHRTRAAGIAVAAITRRASAASSARASMDDFNLLACRRISCLDERPGPAAVDQRARGLIDATPLEPASHDPSLQYHEITAEARMSEPPGDIPILDISASDNIDEDLACLGLRRAFKDDFFADLKKQAEEEYFAYLKKQAEEKLAKLPKPYKP